jgi:hypothetical protein
MKRVLFLGLILVLAATSGAWAVTTPIQSGNHFLINVANDAGGRFSSYDTATYGAAYNQYYYKFDGGGLNAEYIGLTPTSKTGQVTSTSNNSLSGTFYATDQGGRGFTDNAILMISLSKLPQNNFIINIAATGYSWTPNPTANVAPTSTSYTSFNETFGASDFIYGPNSGKPAGPTTIAFYNGQPAGSMMYSMFVDLNLGMFNQSSLTDNGQIKLTYTINNLYSDIAFNEYGWMLNSNQGQGISFSNPTTTDSYAILYTGPAPVPVPPSIFLMLGGLGGLGVVRKRWMKK